MTYFIVSFIIMVIAFLIEVIGNTNVLLHQWYNLSITGVYDVFTGAYFTLLILQFLVTGKHVTSI